MKKLLHACMAWLCCALFIVPPAVFGQTTLTAGDIVVLGWNVDESYPGQRWVFMTMVDLAMNTSIIFTDNGYDGSTGQFRTGATNDGYMRWVTPSAIAKGTVIYATNATINGSTSGVTGQLGATTVGFHPAGDQVIVYQGTSGTATGATFIFALNTGQSLGTYGSNGNWQTSGTVTVDNQSYRPPGLTSANSVALTAAGTGPSGTGSVGSANYGFDNMYYGGTTSGSKTTLLTAVTNAANWAGHDITPWNFASGFYPSNSFTVLPVNLLNFTAQLQTAESVQLKWATALEINNDHFTIQRSFDGVHYTPIGTVQSMGDNTQPTEYVFTDHRPEPGTNYYRLSQTDKDGKGKILGVRTVTVQNISLRVGPNPVARFIDASFAAGTWKEIRLWNDAGQLVQAITLPPPDRRIRIELGKHRSGTYYLAFIGGDGKTNVVKKFLKKE